MTLLHLSRLEFYRMNPGLFFDMMQLHKGKNEKREDDFEQCGG